MIQGQVIQPNGVFRLNLCCRNLGNMRKTPVYTQGREIIRIPQSIPRMRFRRKLLPIAIHVRCVRL
ncbi:MAG: hypothetical protein BWY82_02878 [Verrucomicrobia bacterium ADurb.Bin474]|nr:MAG: hypothetical protein BWY82_02878 [Verrucomicrobia bacterium ADurb.Bin474]